MASDSAPVNDNSNIENHQFIASGAQGEYLDSLEQAKPADANGPDSREQEPPLPVETQKTLDAMTQGMPEGGAKELVTHAAAQMLRGGKFNPAAIQQDMQKIAGQDPQQQAESMRAIQAFSKQFQETFGVSMQLNKDGLELKQPKNDNLTIRFGRDGSVSAAYHRGSDVMPADPRSAMSEMSMNAHLHQIYRKQDK